MGVVDDEYGGYENLALHTDPVTGEVDFMGACYSAAGLEPYPEPREVGGGAPPGPPPGPPPGGGEGPAPVNPGGGGAPPPEQPPGPAAPGEHVVIHGLAAAVRYNGQAGILLSWYPDKGRWGVQIGGEDADGVTEAILVKPENFRLEARVQRTEAILVNTGLAVVPDFWDEGLQRALRGSPFELCPDSGGDPRFAPIAPHLGSYGGIMLVGIGSCGRGHNEGDFFRAPAWRGALVRWVEEGGQLVLQGETSIQDVFGWFSLTWKTGSYTRTAHTVSEAGVAALGPRSDAVRAYNGYNVKAVMLRDVPPREQLLRGAPYGDEECAVASAAHGRGRVTFFGDVNAEDATLAMMALMARRPEEA